MEIVLGDNRYGKAETRLLRVTRRGAIHEVRELTVSTALTGEFETVHRSGDNSAVLPTDSQKNAVYAFAADEALGEIEDFALRLARHFAVSSPAARRATVHVDEHAWERIDEHPHAFVRPGAERRQATAIADANGTAWVMAGLTDLLVLKSTGSEFKGFLRDRYTTLQETDDRILATAIAARWRLATLDVDWSTSFHEARAALLRAFAERYSRSLQQTLFDMGRAVLDDRPEIAEIHLSLPNKHHFAVDGGDEVFQIADRPYGLIEGTVRRSTAPDGPAQDW
jgi:urate oxidase